MANGSVNAYNQTIYKTSITSLGNERKLKERQRMGKYDEEFIFSKNNAIECGLYFVLISYNQIGKC